MVENGEANKEKVWLDLIIYESVLELILNYRTSVKKASKTTKKQPFLLIFHSKNHGEIGV